jgi:hypothetical protein
LPIFPASEVKEFIEIERTALRPECGIDSVIGESSGFSITAEFLAWMHDYWFQRTVKVPAGAEPDERTRTLAQLGAILTNDDQ